MSRFLNGPDATAALVALAIVAGLLGLCVVGQWRAALALFLVGGVALMVVSR